MRYMVYKLCRLPSHLLVNFFVVVEKLLGFDVVSKKSSLNIHWKDQPVKINSLKKT